MEEFLTYIAKNLVEFPEEVVITQQDRGNRLQINLQVNKSDAGRLIGRQGQTIRALRNLLNAAAGRHNQKISLELVEMR